MNLTTMLETLTPVTLLLIGGAMAKVGTLLHTMARAFDTFVQDTFWNDNLGITLSSRAGLAAKKGNTKYATFINLLAFNMAFSELTCAALSQCCTARRGEPRTERVSCRPVPRA